MKRLETTFFKLRERNEKALVVYLTAGDPNLTTTLDILRVLSESGVDIIEVGVPFSDPTADGPVIQAASQRSLRNGTTLSAVLDMITSFRKISETPVVLFGYYNPVFRYGNARFARNASNAGVDGVLIVDLPPEESQELRQYTDRAGIDFISLIAPTTPTGRIRTIARASSGFLYYISITGITGTAKPDSSSVKKEVKRIREVTNLPVVVGFGISTAGQAADLSRHADGIVIGSALVRLVGTHGTSRKLMQIVGSYVKEIKNSMRMKR
ncbi:MAG: tryptophan synthase subunit alpha [Deltaproteobacteria bacterium]|nr:tryptophan synthase subunit alpha [Deltaproteobacteria bacterium]